MSANNLYNFDAKLFLNDLLINKKLSQRWNSLVNSIKTQAKNSGGDKKDFTKYLAVLNSFIINSGYNTSASAVLENIKSGKPSIGKTSTGASKLVNDFLSSANLLKNWQSTLLDSYKSGTSALDKFLSVGDYKCTFDQIMPSFTNALSNNFEIWTGIYASSSIISGNTSTRGPIIIIGGDNVSIGSELLDKDLNKLQYKDGVLSWEPGDFGNSGGKIYFSRVQRPSTKDSYVGNEVFGNIDWYENGTIKSSNVIIARLGRPPIEANDSKHSKPRVMPPSIDLVAVNNAANYLRFLFSSMSFLNFLTASKSFSSSLSEFLTSTDSGINKNMKMYLSSTKSQVFYASL